MSHHSSKSPQEKKVESEDKSLTSPGIPSTSSPSLTVNPSASSTPFNMTAFLRSWDDRLGNPAFLAPLLAPAEEDNLVRLNVYEAHELNRICAHTDLGLFISGVQVHGIEWSYTVFHAPVSGIFHMTKPRLLGTFSRKPGTFTFKETIEMGRTDYSPVQVQELVSRPR